MSQSSAEILQELRIEQPPHGAGGRYYTHCPFCRSTRSSSRRNEKTLGVTIDNKGVMFGCNHCGTTGGSGYGGERAADITYVYRDEEGAALFRVMRGPNKPDGKKTIWQERKTPDGWEKGLGKDVRRVIYNLPEVLQAGDQAVYLVEGEKDVESLRALGFIATCNPGGAADSGQASKWKDEYSEMLRGRDVVVVPDNDGAGYAHAYAAAKGILARTKRVRVLRIQRHWPACPDKGDVSDWLKAGCTAEKLRSIVDALSTWAGDPIDFTSPGTTEAPADRRPELLSSSAFVLNFTPPDYLIDGILQRRYCYSLTAPTGTGKTSILLHIISRVALGEPVGSRSTEQGAVCFLAGENPDDVRSRWMASAQHTGFDIESIPVYFIEGVFALADIKGVVTRKAQELGIEFSMVVVDTSAAYDLGDDENSNAQMKKHARTLRSLVELPGKPTVVAACHPAKNADPDNLLPRGGGAFVAEVDGILVCKKTGEVIEMHWQGKFRGVDFDPVPFQIEVVTADKLKDQKGRLIPTVIAKTISDAEHRNMVARARSEEDEVVRLLDTDSHLSVSQMAEKLSWTLKTGKNFGEPHKSKVFRVLERLRNEGLAKRERGQHVLTEKGGRLAKKLA